MANQQLPLQLGSRFRAPRSLAFGGSLAVGRQKKARPMDSRRPLHLCFKSARARGEWNLRARRNQALVNNNLTKYAAQFGIKVDRVANVGNHLHLVIRFVKAPLLKKFLRTFSAVLSRQITGARKGNPQGKFWSQIVFSRVINWGRDYETICQYIGLNQTEARVGSSGRTFAATVESRVRALNRWFAHELAEWRKA